MAVLLSYHKLVERDAKHVDMTWKAGSIILLVCAIICSIGVSLSLHKIISSFDDRCILNAQIELETEEQRVNYFFLKRSSSPKQLAPLKLEVTVEKSLLKLTDQFNETYAKFLNAETSLEFPADQVQFLANNEINERDTAWGPKASCDFGVYIPISQTCFGIIMATMFVICGKGGKSDPNAFLPQPWRIVSPALIFFLIMTILSIVNLVIIQYGMKNVCESFEKAVPDLGCDIAMNRYMIAPTDQIKLSPSAFYKMLTSFNYTAFAFWLLSLLMMLARIIFVIDFQLVRVTVKTVEYENARETNKLKAVDVEADPSRQSINYKPLNHEKI